MHLGLCLWLWCSSVLRWAVRFWIFRHVIFKKVLQRLDKLTNCIHRAFDLSVWFLSQLHTKCTLAHIHKLWGDIQAGWGGKKKNSETTVYLVSGRWQSWTTICFPICTRLQCCLPCRQQPASSISLPRVCLSLCCDRRDISCALNRETSGYVMHLIPIFWLSAMQMRLWHAPAFITRCTRVLILTREINDHKRCQHHTNRCRQGASKHHF